MSEEFKQMISSLPNNSETWLNLAKWAESAERYDDMVEACKRLIQVSSALSEDERNLVSVAYKNIVDARRSAYRILTNIQSKSDDNSSHGQMMSEYKERIRSELNTVCNEVIKQIDDALLPKVAEDDIKSRVFYRKMKADYYRYLVEASHDDTRAVLAAKSREAYEAAYKDAEPLGAANPIRLGLALNFSVYHYEIGNDSNMACALAKKAFDEAIAELDTIKEDNYKDSTLIMQLLRDNLTLWTSEQDQEQDDD